MSSLTPVDNFDDIHQLMRQLPTVSEASVEKARAREAKLTKPAGSLGRLEALSEWLSAWQSRYPAKLDHVQIVIFAGNHGVTKQNISAFPASVTAQMVDNFTNGGAAINQLARNAGAELKVIPLDLDKPTQDFTKKPAMTEAETVQAFNAGLEAVESGWDLLVLGEMGIGNTTIAAALCTGLFGGPTSAWTGPGTGLDDKGVLHKTNIIAKGLEKQAHLIGDPVDALRALQAVGGREHAAICGAITAARLLNVPVLLDGFVVAGAAAVLYHIQPDSLDHTLTGHCSKEHGHRLLLDKFGHQPLLEFGMRLGEASGATLAVPLLRGALACHIGMATFEEAAVDNREG